MSILTVEQVEQKDKVKLIVPTEMEIDASQLEGDTESGIRFEIKPEDVEEQSEYVKEKLASGARVFITESDCYLVINPEENLQATNS